MQGEPPLARAFRDTCGRTFIKQWNMLIAGHLTTCDILTRVKGDFGTGQLLWGYICVCYSWPYLWHFCHSPSWLCLFSSPYLQCCHHSYGDVVRGPWQRGQGEEEMGVRAGEPHHRQTYVGQAIKLNSCPEKKSLKVSPTKGIGLMTALWVKRQRGQEWFYEK